MNRLFYHFSLNQCFHFLPYAAIRTFHQFPDNTVGGSIRPVWLRKSILINSRRFRIVQYAPWIIYFCLSKYIAIIPAPDFTFLVTDSIGSQKLFHFRLGKTKMLRIIYIKD